MISPAPPNSLERPDACPSLMKLAAYVDRTVGDLERQAIEAHLAACEACSQAVDDGRLANESSGASASMTFVPPHVLAAAMSLVGGAASEPAPMPAAASRRSVRWAVAARRSAALAACLAFAALGYQLGAIWPASTEAATGDRAADELHFGLLNAADRDASSADLFADLIPETLG